jgi:sugar lactone lactonase YvrE
LNDLCSARGNSSVRRLGLEREKLMTRTLIITIAAIVTLCVLSAGGVSAHPAWGIVVDRNNQVYFSDLETVWKIDATGKLTVFRAGVSGRHVHELAIDEGGNLYGADYTYEPATQSYINAIWKMTPAGGFSYLLAPTNSLPRGMSIWRDRDGNSYFVEQNNQLKRETLLLKRTPDGRASVLAGGSYGHVDGRGGQARFGSIVGMAFRADGSLYVADDFSVRRVAMDGTVKTIADGLNVKSPDRNSSEGALAWGSLMGLAVNAQGDVYVADHRNRRVLKVTSGGAVSTVAQAEQQWSPTGVAIGANGDLYILEVQLTPPSTITTRVRRLSPDGRITVLTAAGENKNASDGESATGGSSERNAQPGRTMPYVLLGLGVSLCVLTIVVWRLRRRTSEQSH